MDYNSDISISDSQKLTNGTKEAFDTILKVAMKKADDSKTINYGQDNILVQSSDSHNVQTKNNEELNKSFIIKEFSGKSNLRIQSNPPRNSHIVKPIPMPRKSKTIQLTAKAYSSSNNSLQSQKTYVIESDIENKVHSNAHDSSVHRKETELSISSKDNSKVKKSDIESTAGHTEAFETVNISAEKTKESHKYGEITESASKNIASDINSKFEPHEIKGDKQDIYNYNKILEMIIHKTDHLQLNSYITYPAVKIHIVDINTGKYYPKSNKNRSVVFYYENEDYILPIMTSSYNLQKKRTFNPVWEESVFLNEDFNYLANENIIIFFEVVDNMPVSSRSSDKLQRRTLSWKAKYFSDFVDYVKGWHRIAFAFLKPIGKGQFCNFNKILKLQLYLYQQRAVKKQEVCKCDLWDLWKTNKLKKYPSAFYVTVKEIVSPKKVTETFRSRTPLQKENVLPNNNVKNTGGCSHIHNRNEINMESTSSKYPKESIQLPSKYSAKIDTNENGCFLLKFSNNGLYLACVVQIEETFTVIVYLVDTFEEINNFNEHCGFIYNLKWASDDSLLLTASADNTVAVWNFQTHNFEQILPHPMYVYTCHIDGDNSIIVTGCFDTIIRIWKLNKHDKKYELHQEIERHNGYITSVCMNKTTTNLYSSDSVGRIIDWKKLDDEWTFERDMILPDLGNTVINEILLFPNEKKMLVHSRDSILRIISIKRICVLYWLRGAFNSRIPTFCSISPCGNYVSSGSENGLIVVWNAKTGKDLTSCDPFPSSLCVQPIHCVQFHPKHVTAIALSHYGSNLPILLYKCEETGEEVTEKQEITMKNNALDGHNLKNSIIVHERIDLTNILHKIDKILK